MKRLILIFFLVHNLYSIDSDFQMWIDYSQTKESQNMSNWIRCKLRSEFESTKCNPFLSNHPKFYGKFGIFVTLLKNRKVRGCYGAFSHKSNQLDVVLIEYLQGAIKEDTRFSPIEESELDSIFVVITIADKPFPIRSKDYKSNFGLLLNSESGQSFVIVPVENYSESAIRSIIKREKIVDEQAFRALTIR